MEQPPREDVEWRESCDVINEGTIGVPKDYRVMGVFTFLGKVNFATYSAQAITFYQKTLTQDQPPKIQTQNYQLADTICMQQVPLLNGHKMTWDSSPYLSFHSSRPRCSEKGIRVCQIILEYVIDSANSKAK